MARVTRTSEEAAGVTSATHSCNGNTLGRYLACDCKDTRPRYLALECLGYGDQGVLRVGGRKSIIIMVSIIAHTDSCSRMMCCNCRGLPGVVLAGLVLLVLQEL